MPTLQRFPDHQIGFSTIEGDAVDASDHVKEVRVSKSLGSPAGKWIVTLTHAHDYGTLPANTLTNIYLSNSGARGLTNVMTGLLDRPGRRIGVGGDGKPAASFGLSGRDMGKLLVNHDVWFNQYSEGSSQDFALRSFFQNAGRVFTVNGPANRVVGAIFQEFFVNKVQIELMFRPDVAQARGFRLFDGSAPPAVTGPAAAGFPNLAGGFVTDFQATEGERDDVSVLSESGSLWNILLRNADSPFNELYTTSLTGGGYLLRLRPAPFDTDGRLSSGLIRHRIDPVEVVDEDLGHSDAERVNLVVVWPAINTAVANIAVQLQKIGAQNPGGEYLSADPGSAFTHGLRKLFVTTPYITGLHGGSGQAILSQLEQRMKRLWGWYRNNHTYRSGTLLIAGRPEITVGEAIHYDGFEFYVEHVSHHYKYGERYTTTLGLTRGQRTA